MPFCPVIARLLLVIMHLVKRIVHVLLDCGDTCNIWHLHYEDDDDAVWFTV